MRDGKEKNPEGRKYFLPGFKKYFFYSLQERLKQYITG
jgi:hypothetical protein